MRGNWGAVCVLWAGLGIAGCGGADSGSTTPTDSGAPAVDLGQPGDAADSPTPAGDATPVLPIPDDAPGNDAAPAAATINPIPDDAP